MSTTTHASHGAMQAQPVQQQNAQADGEELQRFNEDAAAARHLTAIRIHGIRGQFNDGEEPGQPG